MKKLIRAVTLTTVSLFAAAAPLAAADPARGAIDVAERGLNFGTVKKARASGVPRQKPHPTLDALDRWRASSEAFATQFVTGRGGNGTETFNTRHVYEDHIGQAHIRLTGTIAGLPVVGSDLILHVDMRTDVVIGVNGRFPIDRGLSRNPDLKASEAITAALREYGVPNATTEDKPELTYIIDDDSNVRLAWTALVSHSSANGAELDRIYADAVTGSAIARHPQIRHAMNRETYWCNGSEPYLPSGKPQCILVACDWNCGWSPYPGSQGEAAHNHAGTTYNYFWSRHGRDSLDGGGMLIKQAVDSGSSSDAGWYGDYEFVLYPGEGYYYPAPAYSLDIVAHELTHGVVHYAAWLPYVNEQGSIDEGIADVFAVAVDAYRDGAPDWWIAEDVYSPTIIGDAMRYLDYPALQPGQRDYYPERRRNETHENAGIVGLAYFKLSHGGLHPRLSSGPYVMPVGRIAAEDLFYRTLAAYMTSTTNFRTLRQYMLWAAADIYGLQSGPYIAVNDAWAVVGNHWDEHFGTLTAGSSWTSASYTTTMQGLHTSQLVGPQNGSDFDLHLERWNGSAWTAYTSMVRPGANELIEAFPNPNVTYRWRVQAVSGSGYFSFYWNKPL
ncbi:MAG TPA: M4 family metallopeptidase [Thermoanaerobaculia bacterium]|nr:M4 family metallopeptidase [Thermoanaerobaculia bacterium]